MKIKAKNFLSWKDLDYTFQEGITLISGWNSDDNTPEASGKSAILNAMCWTLFGKLPKDAKIDDVIHEGADSCETTLTFDDGSFLTRSRNPNYIELVDAIKGPIEGKDARETQSLIEAYIGISFDTFCQTIYFAQNYPKKFITSNQEEKGKILSEIQNLDQFDRAIKKTKELIKNLKPNIQSTDTQVQVLKAQVTEKNSKIFDTKQVIAKNLTQKENRLRELEADIKLKLQNQKQLNLEAIDLEIKSITDNLSELESLISDLNTQREANLSLEGSLREKTDSAKIVIQRKENLTTELKILLTKIESIRTKEEFEAWYKERLAQAETDQATLNELKANLADLEASEATCPTCKQSWEGAESHKEKTLLPLKTKITQLGSKLAQTAAQLKTQKETYLKERETLKELKTEFVTKRTQMQEIDTSEAEQLLNEVTAQLQELARARIELDDKRIKLKNEANQLILKKKSLEATLKGHETLKNDLNNLKAEYQMVKKQNDSSLEDALKRYEVEKSIVMANLSAKTKELDALQLELNDLETLADGFKNTKVLVFKTVLSELNRLTNDFLQKLFDIPVTLNFYNEEMKIESTLKINGTERALGLCSGGQTRRIMLAVDLALAKIIQNRNNNKFNVLFFDEVCKDLSENSMDRVLNVLKDSDMRIIMIEHNSIFKSIIDNTLEIEYRAGVSTIKNG